MKPLPFERYQVRPESAVIPHLLRLIQSTFAYMDGRVSPPSSVHRLTRETLQENCARGEVWAIGPEPAACVFLTTQERCLYLGKLAVDPRFRRRGLARRMIETAEERARAQGHDVLELETRIELTENHAAFRRLGFKKSGEGAHDGYDHPTYIVMQKRL